LLTTLEEQSGIVVGPGSSLDFAISCSFGAWGKSPNLSGITFLTYKMEMRGSTWVVQSGKRPTLDLGSGHDLRVVTSSPASGSTLGVQPA